MLFDLSHRMALVTGAARGLGFEIAKRFGRSRRACGAERA